MMSSGQFLLLLISLSVFQSLVLFFHFFPLKFSLLFLLYFPVFVSWWPSFYSLPFPFLTFSCTVVFFSWKVFLVLDLILSPSSFPSAFFVLLLLLLPLFYLCFFNKRKISMFPLIAGKTLNLAMHGTEKMSWMMRSRSSRCQDLYPAF